MGGMVMSRVSWEDYFLEMAQATATRATCSRRQVGAVIVDKDRRVVSTGYNGSPSGLAHCIDGACPRGRIDSVSPDSDYDSPGSPGFCIAVHAEANALFYARQSVKDATIYVTDSPCPGCTKLLAAAGISLAIWPSGGGVPTRMLERMAQR